MNRSAHAVARPAIPQQEEPGAFPTTDEIPTIAPNSAVESPLARGSRSSLFLGTGLDGPGGIESLKREVARYDLALALDLIVERLAALRNVSGVAIAVERESVMSCVACTGSAPALGAPIHSGAGLSGECIRTRKSVFCADTSSDPRVDPTVCEGLGLRSVLIVPVFRDAAFIGLIELFSAAPEGLTHRHRSILESVAQIVAEVAHVHIDSMPKSEDIADESETVPEELDEPLPVVSEPALASVLHEAEIAPEFSVVPSDPTFTVPMHWKSPLSVRIGRLQKYLIIGFLAAVALTAGILLLRVSRKMAAAPQANATQERVNVDLFGPPPTAAPSSVSASTATVPVKKSSTKAAPEVRDAEVVRAPKAAHSASSASSGLKPLVPFKKSDKKSETPGAAAIADASEPTSLTPIGISASSLPTDLLTPKPSHVSLKASEQSGGKLLKKVLPVYPSAARLGHLNGTVRLVATIDASGKVSDVRVVSGTAPMLKAAEDAVRQWEYQPLLVDGKPTPTQAQVQVIFNSAR